MLLTLLGVLALSKEVVLGIDFVWWMRTERSLGRSRFFEFLEPILEGFSLLSGCFV